jgi:hypothetical protein
MLPSALDSFLSNNVKSNADGIKNTESLNLDDRFGCFVIMNQSEDNPRNYQIDIGVDLNHEADEGEDDDDEDEDEEEHDVPCSCDRIKCVLIKATIEKYDSEAANAKSSS